MVKIFDTHAHFDDRAFDKDRYSLIESFPENGVQAAVNIGVNLESSEFTTKLVKKYDFMYGTVGVHPSDIREMESMNEIPMLRKLAEDNDKIVAIGEIGLDYHYDNIDRLVQQKWFSRQMELAREIELPIVVHSRDAAKDTLDIMRESKADEIGGVIHCYSYSTETARDFLNMDFYFGIGGVVTFKRARKLKEAVEYIPLDKIVLETDSPYLTPEPHRHHRNSSINLTFVAEAIAEIKNISVDKVYEITWENALKLYRI